MSFSDIEHFATVLSGCESINSGDRISDNARYAFGVLKLHATDFSAHAGQEGFLDQVKKTAGNTKEWLIKLIKAIKEFFFGSNVQKFRKAKSETEVIVKDIEKIGSNPEAVIGKTVPELIKNNAELAGKSGWPELTTAYNQLTADEKKDAEDKLQKALAEDKLNQAGEQAVSKIKSRLNSIATSITAAANTIYDFSKGKEHITYELNGLSKDSEKSLIDEVLVAIKHLKVSNLASTVKWIINIADSYSKDLEIITRKADDLIKKTDQQHIISSIGVISNAYAKVIKGYQDMVIAINAICRSEIGKTQDALIRSILTKHARNTKVAADAYSGISTDAAISDFYNR
jgi:hypothetical protein